MSEGARDDAPTISAWPTGDGLYDCKVAGVWHRACTVGEVTSFAAGAKIDWEPSKSQSGLQRGRGWTRSCYPVPGGWQWSVWVAGVGGQHGFAYHQDDAEAAANRAMAGFLEEQEK